MLLIMELVLGWVTVWWIGTRVEVAICDIGHEAIPPIRVGARTSANVDETET